MSVADLRNLVRQYVQEVWNRAHTDAIDEFVAESYTYHLGGQPPRDKGAMKQFVQSVHAAFPDWHVEIEDIVADEQLVAVRWQGEATHNGTFHGIPPTGKHLSVCGINMYRVADGVIIQEWEQMDSLWMLQQMGALPPPRPATD